LALFEVLQLGAAHRRARTTGRDSPCFRIARRFFLGLGGTAKVKPTTSSPAGLTGKHFALHLAKCLPVRPVRCNALLDCLAPNSPTATPVRHPGLSLCVLPETKGPDSPNGTSSMHLLPQAAHSREPYRLPPPQSMTRAAHRPLATRLRILRIPLPARAASGAGPLRQRLVLLKSRYGGSRRHGPVSRHCAGGADRPPQPSKPPRHRNRWPQHFRRTELQVLRMPWP
jgi:hypothetical protein